MLNLRYNEMWHEWDGTDESPELCSIPDTNGRMVLSWKRLNVSVRQIKEHFFKSSKITHKQILHNVSGNVQCGSLLGIMGPSGSGKTTLMATISHRTKGNFDGELLLNGKPISEEIMIKISGFVPQQDVNFDKLTTLEHLTLMANLKSDRHTTKSTLNENINRVTTALGMAKFLNTRILFLSGGERKKVALAVQLLNNPPILFCDEITTGLDSYSAAHIVNMLKGIARTGKIVICTIHQPASGVFGKFDEVVLLSNGRLAYQGPVSMVNQLFQKFNYECPRMFNVADFIMIILNSNSENIKRNVDEMCKLSSSDEKTDYNYDLFNNKKLLLDYTQHLHTQKPEWITMFSLILNRSIKCFVRDYHNKLLELGSVWLLGIIISSPFANLKFDKNAVQNWEGFWLIFAINLVFHFYYSAIGIYQEKFSIVHREVHNKIYPLSVYYTTELMIMIVWIVVKMLFYCIFPFWIVGAHWDSLHLLLFFILAIASFSFGNLLSAYINNIENTIIIATVYDYISLPLSGAYSSLKSLPIALYSLRYFSLFFLGCEMISTLFWDKIKILQCVNQNNCLKNGEEVLNKYGYKNNELYFDLLILVAFTVLANIISYIGVYKKLKIQPTY